MTIMIEAIRAFEQSAAELRKMEARLEIVFRAHAAFEGIIPSADHQGKVVDLFDALKDLKATAQATKAPHMVHIGEDYVHVLTSPDAHSDDAVAVVYGETQEERIARAHLFKAAPDLLAALRDVRSGDCWCGMGIGNPMLTGHTQKCIAARVAIAKAEETGL